MLHTHSNAARGAHGFGGGEGEHQVTAAELHRHRRALRILVVVLIPLGIWTLVGLIALWPGDVSSHVNADAAGYSVAGVSYPRAEITAVEEISCDGLPGSTPGAGDNRCANLTATVSSGEGRGDVASVPLTQALYASGAKVGQTIVLIRVPPADGQPAAYQFSDFDRRTPLIVLTVVFAAVVVAVARRRGLASLLGLAFSALILVKFMFPALVAGQNPLVVGLIGSSAIMFVVLYAAHGFSTRTTTALVGTLFGLILIAALGYGATRWAHLTGVATEDDYVLAAAAPDLRLTSVVICGIIVAGLGVLNDVTITQASAVWELADGHYTDADGRTGRLRNRDLFSRAMRIGRDHIASTVYTIIFATAGASLSVLLLIAVYDRPLLQVLQTEQLSDELIRSLVGAIGLVLAVPLTTAIGVAVVRAGAVPSKTPETEPAEAEPVGQSRRRTSTGPIETDQPTTILPAVPAAAAEGRPKASPGDVEPVPVPDPVGDVISDATESPSRRRWRRSPTDDFGDFSDLRDPDSPAPRRSR